jgi:hypothetical protein
VQLKPSSSSTLLRMPRSPQAVLTARLALITGLADDLARANEGETPATRALADAIKREVDGVSRALRRPQRYSQPLATTPLAGQRHNAVLRAGFHCHYEQADLTNAHTQCV